MNLPATFLVPLLGLLLAAASPRTVALSVTESGFEPGQIALKQGEPVHLVVTRKTDNTCATAILIRDLGIKKALPLGQPVAIDFTPLKSGEVRYTCGMKRIGGVLLIQ